MTEEYGHISDAFHLSEQEVEKLRKSKKELTDYGKQKLKELMTEKPLSLDEMMDIANQRENQENIYQYRVIDYFASGEGRTIYLQISRANSPQYPEDYFENRWTQFVEDFYMPATEELTETQFLERYTRLIPNAILRLHREKTLTIWQQHFHFNRC